MAKIIEIRVKLNDTLTNEDTLELAEILKDKIYDEDTVVEEVTYEIMESIQ